MARTLEEIDQALGQLEDKVGADEITLGTLSTNVGAISQKLATLTLRLSLVDGQGSAKPDESSLAQLATLVNGLKTTVEQVTLVLQSDMDAIKQQMSDLQGLLNQHLGVV